MRCDMNGENGVYVAEMRGALCFSDAAVMFLIHNILSCPSRAAEKPHSSRRERSDVRASGLSFLCT